MLKKIIIIAILTAINSFSYAKAQYLYAPLPPKTFTPAIYIGMQGGYAILNWNNLKNSKDNGYGEYGEVSGNSAVATRFYLGYNCYQNFSFEIGYTQFFNKTKIQGFFNSKEPKESITIEPKYSLAIDVSGKFKLHIVDNLNAYIQLGFDYYNPDSKYISSVYNALIGAGCIYNITQNISINASWLHFNGMPKWNIDYIPYTNLYAFGFSYKFNLI